MCSHSAPTHLSPFTLNERRLACVQTEIQAENDRNIAAAIACFYYPRYEFVPFDQVAEGATALYELLERLFTGFPNFYSDVFTTYCADNAVIIEGRLVAAQYGPWAGLPASGRVINLPFVAIFAFDAEHLLSKRVYFDAGLMMRQLTGQPD
jgi:predicted ester cyclase